MIFYAIKKNSKPYALYESIFREEIEKTGIAPVYTDFDQMRIDNGITTENQWYGFKIVSKFIIEFGQADSKEELKGLGYEEYDTDFETLQSWAHYQRQKRYGKRTQD